MTPVSPKNLKKSLSGDKIREVSPPIKTNDYRKNINNTIALTSQWRIFDGGRSTQLKQKNISRKREFQAKYIIENNRINETLENSYVKLVSAKKNILKIRNG